MKITIVSTFSDNYYKEYSKFFVESLQEKLHESIDVILYTDNINISTSNIQTRSLSDSCPSLTDFKKRNKNRTFSTFVYDGVKFAHKSYAIAHAGLTIDSDILIWLDGDSELITEIGPEYFLNKLPKDYYTHYFGRSGTFSETGFIAFDLRNPNSKTFFSKIKEYYDSDKIYTLDGFTDCHVYDAVREEMESNNLIKSCNLTPSKSKNHFNDFFKGYIIHLKGGKKDVREKHLKKAGVLL